MMLLRGGSGPQLEQRPKVTAFGATNHQQ